MTTVPTGRHRRPATESRSDADLVRACLDGDEEAWAALIERYKRLLYSVLLRYGTSPEDAADLFQAVCVELYTELPRLRKVDSLRSWLITVATHQAFHWKKRHRRRLEREGTELDEQTAEAATPPAPDGLEELERAHLLQEGMARLTPRCRELVRLLFFRDPPLPYDALARELGLATGSIGFIRGRCLQKLGRELTALGF